MEYQSVQSLRAEKARKALEAEQDAARGQASTPVAEQPQGVPHTLVSRVEAKANGLKRYYTGEPCKFGHDSERFVTGARCVECSRVQSYANYVKKRADDPETTRKAINTAVKRHYSANRDQLLAKKKQYYENNRELLKQRSRDSRKKQRDQEPAVSA